MSLPNVNPAGLERLTPYMAKPGSHHRQQRAIIQDLLKDLKGVSVSEMGKMPKSSGLDISQRGRRGGQNRSQMAQQFMERNQDRSASDPSGTGARGATPDGLEGVSGLFES